MNLIVCGILGALPFAIMGCLVYLTKLELTKAQEQLAKLAELSYESYRQTHGEMLRMEYRIRELEGRSA